MRGCGWMVTGLACVLLNGCSASFDSVPALGVAPAGVQGKAMGGQQPVGRATVTLYEVGTSGYGTGANPVDITFTKADGTFALHSSDYSCTAANSPMYLVVTGGNPGAGTNSAIAMAAALGPCGAAQNASVIVNEVTTAATVLALGQFMGATLGASGTAFNIGGTCSGCATGVYNQGLVRAMNVTYPQLVDNASGTALQKHSVGNVAVTPETTKINAIANVLAACVNSTGATDTSETSTVCGKLFTGVNFTVASPRPSDTLQAALQMQLYPFYNVPAVYALAGSSPPFVGPTAAPADWTVAVSYVTSSFGLGIQRNTSSTLDIDAAGNVWVPSNKTGAVGLVMFDPAAVTFNGPYGGSALVYPQYVAIDHAATPFAWASDATSGNVSGVSTTPGSVAVLGSQDLANGGPLTVDTANNVLVASLASARNIYVIGPSRTSLSVAQSNGLTYAASGAPNGIAALPGFPYTMGIVAADTSSACNLEVLPTATGIRVSTGDSNCIPGGVIGTPGGFSMTTSTGYLCLYTNSQGCVASPSLNNPKGLAFDGRGVVWIANAGNASVVGVNSSSGLSGGAYVHNGLLGNAAPAPYGVGVDGSGNVWLSNVNCVGTPASRCNPGSLGLIEVVGVAGPTITPVSAQTNANAFPLPTK